MRQRISHGQEIDAATPQEVASIFANTMARERPTEYRRYKNAVNLDANGAFTTKIADLLVPAQYDLLLERVTFGGAGLLATTTIGVYENQPTDTDLLEWVVVGAPLKYSDAFSNRIFVTANSAVIIQWTGGTANSQATYNLQGRLIRAHN